MMITTTLQVSANQSMVIIQQTKSFLNKINQSVDLWLLKKLFQIRKLIVGSRVSNELFFVFVGIVYSTTSFSNIILVSEFFWQSNALWFTSSLNRLWNYFFSSFSGKRLLIHLFPRWMSFPFYVLATITPAVHFWSLVWGLSAFIE